MPLETVPRGVTKGGNLGAESTLAAREWLPVIGKVGRDCAIRSQCTGNQFRSVSRLENEAVLDRMQARIAQRPDILDKRRETVEHPFGTIKQWMNQGAFLMRGLEKVRGEFSLTALAYNLRRVLNIVELPKLIATLPA